MLNCDWIDTDVLLGILQAEQGSEQREIKIVSFKVEPATKKGDNYASEMYRASIEYDQDGRRTKCKRILKVFMTFLDD